MYLPQIILEASNFAAAIEGEGGSCRCSPNVVTQQWGQRVGGDTCNMSDRLSLYSMCHESVLIHSFVDTKHNMLPGVWLARTSLALPTRE